MCLFEMCANESVALLEELSILTHLGTRKLSLSDRVARDDLPSDEFYFSSKFGIAQGDEESPFQILSEKYLLPACRNLARQIELCLANQITNLLLLCDARIPTSILGIKNCLDWLDTRCNHNHTRTSGRSLVLTPDSETRLCKLLDFKELDPCNLGRIGLCDIFMSQIISSHNLMMQKDAVIFTFSQLAPWAEVGQIARTAKYNNQSLRCQGGFDAETQTTLIKLDVAVQVTQINCLHCCLIPVENFV